jgi:hypothetical protein
MLADYRHWLETELKLLGNASRHDAYSSGQANMTKRALERFDQELKERVALTLERGRVDAVLTALEQLHERETALDPSLDALRVDLQTALAQGTA